MNITDYFHIDYLAAPTQYDKWKVWRMYVYVMQDELAMPSRSALQSTIKLRTANCDEERATRFAPYWAALTNDELEELQNALQLARYGAEEP